MIKIKSILRIFSFRTTGLLLGLLACFFAPVLSAQEADKAATKNIILMISDGCGFNHILATNCYITGNEQAQVYESFPYRLAVSTFPAKESDSAPLIEPGRGYLPDSAWLDFEYVKKGWTDSAPAATTLASGVKTYNGAIGVDVAFQPVATIAERAKQLGKAAGLVTSVPLSHATPAGFAAHNKQRSNYEEIAREMLIDSRLDVLMGCGNPAYDHDGKPVNVPVNYKFVGGKAVWDSLVAGATVFSEAAPSGNRTVSDIDGDNIPDPWFLIQNREDFQQFASGRHHKRILGVPGVAATLQQMRQGTTDSVPFSVPFNPSVPVLAEMSMAALQCLSGNSKGFFLMIEGGAVDWANHDRHAGRMIEEQHDFNLAVEAVVKWIEAHGGWDANLLIVTSDHECGYLTGPKPGNNDPRTNPVRNRGRGMMPLLRYNSDTHTNMLVPLFAKGRGAEMFLQAADGKDPVRGPYLDNTDIAKIMFRLWE
ncbi:MAG TPA: alkaline phosphatase [Bacteroidales bacterium]|nr:alkaline phosphatase [Bacteroidales bacterium]HSA42085.1 alkaline phosphatase [Bacteroidales bacterium]